MIDSIYQQISRCWKVPKDEPFDVSATIETEYGRSGALKSAKLIESQQAHYKNDAAFRVVADSALKALQTCSPLQNLPADRYTMWQKIILTFDNRPPPTKAIP